MCARYTLRPRSLADVAATLDAETPPTDGGLYSPRFNVSPTDIGWIVSYDTGRRILRPARWRYLIGASRPLVNIRSESMVFRRFRDAFASNRCAVVTDGFYAWTGNDLNPLWFHMADDGLMLLGGLLQPARATGARPRFSVLTTRANARVARFHDRMPVIIALSQLDEWLTAPPEAALEMLTPIRMRGLVATRVSAYVNEVKHDDAKCIASPSDEA
jgi:putative SOS response-associated peptidase YedK